MSDKTRHEKRQHGEKSFVCGGTNNRGLSWGCDRSFSRKDGLLEHHRRTEKGKQCIEQLSAFESGRFFAYNNDLLLSNMLSEI